METRERRHAKRTKEEINRQESQRWWPLPGLRRVRLEQNMPQKELSRLSGIARPNLSRLENGGQSAQWRTVKKLARVLDCAPLELIQEEDKPM